MFEDSKALQMFQMKKKQKKSSQTISLKVSTSRTKKIVDIQTNKMQVVPIKFEMKDMKEFAQLDLRYRLAMLTNQISILTEGILSMNKTVLIGK